MIETELSLQRKLEYQIARRAAKLAVKADETKTKTFAGCVKEYMDQFYEGTHKENLRTWIGKLMQIEVKEAKEILKMLIRFELAKRGKQ